MYISPSHTSVKMIDRKRDTKKYHFSSLPTTFRPWKDDLKPTSSAELTPFALTVSLPLSLYHCRVAKTAFLCDGVWFCASEVSKSCILYHMTQHFSLFYILYGSRRKVMSHVIESEDPKGGKTWP